MKTKLIEIAGEIVKGYVCPLCDQSITIYPLEAYRNHRRVFHQNPDDVRIKLCLGCQRHLPISMFVNNGRSHSCRLCINKSKGKNSKGRPAVKKLKGYGLKMGRVNTR